jgi:hypothetical protein
MKRFYFKKYKKYLGLHSFGLAFLPFFLFALLAKDVAI